MAVFGYLNFIKNWYQEREASPFKAKKVWYYLIILYLRVYSLLARFLGPCLDSSWFASSSEFYSTQRLKVFSEKNDREIFFWKGWRAKYSIWFRQKISFLSYLAFHMLCCDSPLLAHFIYLFPGAILKAAPRWRHVARRDDINTKRTFREGEKKEEYSSIYVCECVISRYFSPSNGKKKMVDE